jgi:dihydrofolate synthase / folylpolyglutamate synthase
VDAYLQTLDWIYNLRGGVIDLRLERMDEALALFGHPERQFPALHIAGTNGKGSTAAMLHRILTLGGFRVGLYTSPHLVCFTERIRVGDKEISPAEVVELADEIRTRITPAGVPLTFFEIVTVMAFLYLARQQIDVGVIEVGLGGRLDATNLVRPLVTMITTISKDHEAYLGSDVLSIGREKAGIIKPGVPVVCGPVPSEVAALIKQVAEEKCSPSYFLGADFKFFLNNERFFDYKGIKRHFSDISVALHGRHQRSNAAMAIAALELAGDSFAVGEEAIRRGLDAVAWPGRFEIMRERPWVILDGAHNGEGASALAEVLKEFRRGRRIKLLFAAMEDKDWRTMLALLLPLVDEVMVTRVRMERSAEPGRIAGWVAGSLPHRVAEEARTGLKLLFQEARPDDIILVAGSLYLVGEVRPTAQELAARVGD